MQAQQNQDQGWQQISIDRAHADLTLDFNFVDDWSEYQSDYNIIRVCQQGETTFISFRHSIKPSIFYRVCV